jgi:hypothetical protein
MNLEDIEENNNEDEIVDDDNVNIRLDKQRFAPSYRERLVNCKHCGAENWRGEKKCVSCSFPIIPSNLHDETVDLDKDVLRRIPPRLLLEHGKNGLKLVLLKILEKTGIYKCETMIQMEDGRVVRCNYPLQFGIETCPQCNQNNLVTYECINKKNPSVQCNQRITLEMTRCPSCGVNTVLGDMINILSGKRAGRETTKFVMSALQPIFPQFNLITRTVPCRIDGGDIVKMATDLESYCKQAKRVLEWMALHLRISTAPRGKVGMTTASFAINALMAGSPRPSPAINELIEQRTREIQSAGNNAGNDNTIINDGEANVVPGTGADDDDDDDGTDWGLTLGDT